MLDEMQEKCLMTIAGEEDKAVYKRVKAKLQNMPTDKRNAYQMLLKLAEEVNYTELALLVAELSILDGRVKFGSTIIEGINSSMGGP